MKLIKISDTHYIIVDDSKIKVNDFITDRYRVWQWKDDSSLLGRKKITHSTQPLEDVGLGKLDLRFNEIFALDLSEVEEAIYGYSVEMMAHNYLQHWRSINNIHLSNVIHAERCKNDYKTGFKAHQELVKDKLFTTEPLIYLLNLLTYDDLDEEEKIESCKEYIKDLLNVKPEWEVEFIDGQLKLKS